MWRHFLCRENPNVAFTFSSENTSLLGSHSNASKPTLFYFHGWMGSVVHGLIPSIAEGYLVGVSIPAMSRFLARTLRYQVSLLSCPWPRQLYRRDGVNSRTSWTVAVLRDTIKDTCRTGISCWRRHSLYLHNSTYYSTATAPKDRDNGTSQ
jgi:hypothetical protein